MAKKSKRFRIGVEGATTDGRVIERDWITQMAASYNPQVYTALINMEHIKGFTLMGLSVVLAWWKTGSGRNHRRGFVREDGAVWLDCPDGRSGHHDR